MNGSLLRLALVLALSQPPVGFAHPHTGHAQAGTPQQAPPIGGAPLPSDGRALSWTQQPLILPAEGAKGGRAMARLKIIGIDTDQLTVIAADGPTERRRLDYPIEAGRAEIASVTPTIGNYHWVFAREETPQVVRLASTAWYFGNRGASPREMLLEPKHALEIIPQPLPREHAHYREAEKWRFLVRFQGKPLANQPVTLETAHGSRTVAFTDADGYATIIFPRDFKPAAHDAAHTGHGRPRASFVLSTLWQADGRRYETAFNHYYAPDPERNRSLAWGALAGLVGMLAATPLLRRRNKGGNGHV